MSDEKTLDEHAVMVMDAEAEQGYWSTRIYHPDNILAAYHAERAARIEAEQERDEYKKLANEAGFATEDDEYEPGFVCGTFTEEWHKRSQEPMPPLLCEKCALEHEGSGRVCITIWKRDRERYQAAEARIATALETLNAREVRSE